MFNLFKKGKPGGAELKMTSRELMAVFDAGMRTLAGVEISPSSAMQIAAVFACVRVISEGVAQLPLHIYRRLPGGGKERADDHPLARLLHRTGPNEWQTPYDFKEFLQGCATLRGNGYALIVRSAGKVIELLPLRQDRVTPLMDSNFRLRYRVIAADGSERIFDRSEIFHLRGLSADAVQGYDPITLQREALGLAKAAERHGSAFFGNAARPSGLMTNDANLNKEQMETMVSSVRAAYSGENAGRPMALDGGWKWTSISLTNEEAQFLETRKFQTSEIARMFRVQPHMIGDLEKATFSNIEQQSLEHVIYTLMPWTTRWEETINKTLLTPQEQEVYFAEFKLEGLLRGDSAARAAFYNSLFQMGAISPNEIRNAENMNPRVGGDVYLVPMNMASKPATDQGGQQ